MAACRAGKFAFSPLFGEAEQFFAVRACTETVRFEIPDTQTKILCAVNDF